ncbi:MAG: PaaI family thioesterase [Bacillota bacterium]
MSVGTDSMCFCCGKDNPVGLKMSFSRDGDLFFSEVTPPDFLQGYSGILHGGITSTLLDEVMANHLLAMGMRAVTADLFVRFKKPVPMGVPLKIISRQVSGRKSLFEMESWLEGPGGEVMATATAKMMVVKGGSTR